MALRDYLSTDYIKTLEHLAANYPLPSGVILELGIGAGDSGRALCKGSQARNDQRLVFGVDCLKMTGTSVGLIIAQLQMNKLSQELMVMTTVKAAQVWNADIALLFIDADHSYEAAKQDYTMFSPYVMSGGLIIFHDSERGSVNRAIEEVTNEFSDYHETKTNETPRTWYGVKQ